VGQPVDGPSAPVLRFDHFKHMVRDIRRARGLDKEHHRRGGDGRDVPPSAAAEAADLFK